MGIGSDGRPPGILQRSGLFLARFCTSAWIGAAALYVVAQIPSGPASQLRHGVKVTLIFPSNDRRLGIITEIPPQTTTGGRESVVSVKIEPAGKLWPKLAIGSNAKVLLP